MSRARKITLALLATTTMGLVLASAAALPARAAALDSTTPDPVLELLDPSQVALAACRAQGRHAFDPRRFVRVAAASTTTPAAAPPRFDGIGPIVLDAPGQGAEVRGWLSQGLAMAYGFNHHAAVVAFREAQRLAPGCSLCWWGEAYALGANINAPMNAGAVGQAREAASEALRRAATPRERALAEAVVARYAEAPGTPAGEAAYAAAMRAAWLLAQDDDNVAALFAESLMNLQPWDYWEADGRTAKGGIGEAIAAVEAVLARNPNHPQAIHLYIHLTEASASPARAEAHADRLVTLAPDVSHLVHMPSHTYYRLGRFKDSLAANIAAMAADEAFLARAEGSALYASGYVPHNIHFALTSAQMAGDGANVTRAATLLPRFLNPEVLAALGWTQAMAAAPYFAHAQFSDAATTMALPEADPAFPYLQASRAYARAVAAVQGGDVAMARAEAARLAGLAASKDIERLTTEAGLPAVTILEVAQAVIEGRIAQAQGDNSAAVAAFERAVALQDSLAYMEPPFWYYPTRQSLGAALVLAGRAAEAAPVLEAALVESPNNGWALFGLAEARKALGNTAGEQAARAALDNAWVGDRAPLVLTRL